MFQHKFDPAWPSASLNAAKMWCYCHKKKQFPHILGTPAVYNNRKKWQLQLMNLGGFLLPGLTFCSMPMDVWIGVLCRRYSQGERPLSRSSIWRTYWRRATEWRLLELRRTAMGYALLVYYGFGWGTSLTLSKWHETPNCFTRNLIQTSQLCYHPSWGKSYFRKNNI